MKPPQLSRLWLLGPPFAITVSILAYYVAFPSVRAWTDAHFPWMAEHIGSHLPVRGGEVRVQRPKTVAALPMREPQPGPTPLPVPAPPPPPVKPVYLLADGAVDLPTLSANPADWPKVLALRKAREFPAVAGGKAVGNILVPKGTEVKLLKIEAGKLGLEYHGGGAWVGTDETDLAERLRSAAR